VQRGRIAAEFSPNRLVNLPELLERLRFALAIGTPVAKAAGVSYEEDQSRAAGASPESKLAPPGGGGDACVTSFQYERSAGSSRWGL
jgi:hypothetical protein